MGNTSSECKKNAKIVFTPEETYKEAGVVLWLQDNLLDLDNDNLHLTASSIAEAYELKSEGRTHQFVYNIVLAYRIRPYKLDLYAELILVICSQLNDPSFFKKFFLRYVSSSYNFRESNIIAVPYLSLLFRCYKNGIFTAGEICEQIEFVKENYSEFSHYLCVLFCWFPTELYVENNKLYKSLLRLFHREKKRWVFPAYLKNAKERISELIKNDDSIFEDVRKIGFIPYSLFDSIWKDDISSFQKFAASPTFNIESELEENPFIPFPILHYSPHLIQVAAFLGSIKCFKYLLLNDADIECVDKAGLSVIHFAIAGGNAEIIRILEQRNVSFIGTPQIAVQYHQKLIFNWLVETKFQDLSEFDKSFGSISHNAAISNNLEVLFFLDNNKVEFDDPSPKGSTPLHFACSNGCFDIVYFLIADQKANIYKTDIELDTALHIAAYQGCTSIARFLITAAKKLINIRNNDNFKPIQIAAINGHDQILSTLLKQKHVDVNESTMNGRTLLHLAVINGHYSAAKAILSQQGVFLSACDVDNNTPLHYAARKNYYKCVKLLLNQNGIGINSYDSNHRTPLHEALRYSSLKMVKLFLKHPHINLNASDQDGKTPLFIAVELKLYPIIKYLISIPDVEVNVKTYTEGVAPLHIAIGHSDKKTLCELEKRPELNYAIRTNNGILFYINRTPLHYAAEIGNLELTKYLLTQKGVELNETTNSGLSALHYAAEHQKEEVVKFLLDQKGINASGKDVSGLGPRGIVFVNGKYVYDPNRRF